MATDTNAFDAYLKDQLHRDIIFRVAVWAVIATAAGFYATRKASFSGFDYFEKSADLLLPLSNLFGSVSVLLVLIALFFKDAEYVDSAQYGQRTKKGKIGGFFRRLAGDISLWVIGTLIGLITALSIAVILALRNQGIKLDDWVAIGWMYFVFLGFLVVMAALNAFVRRAEPPLTRVPPFCCQLRTANRVLLFYGACAIFILAYALYFGG